METRNKLRWGILAAGKIAQKLASAVNQSTSGTLYAVASRSLEKAEVFAKVYGAEVAYGSYEALLADPKVDVIYIATPHPLHAQWAIRCAEAGKHILCEKPICLNSAELTAVMDAVKKHDVFLMEAFMYRCNPQTAKIVELVKEKAIGDVRYIEAAFSFDSGIDRESRLQSNALGGGGILDVGCYPISMTRLIAGVTQGKAFVEPLSLTGAAVFDEETGVDVMATASLKFPGGILAQAACGVRLRHRNELRIHGSEGELIVPAAWFSSGEIILNKYEQEPETIKVEQAYDSYTYEVETVTANINVRQAPAPAMSWADSIGNMKALDLWRQEVGLVYDSEK